MTKSTEQKLRDIQVRFMDITDVDRKHHENWISINQQTHFKMRKSEHEKMIQDQKVSPKAIWKFCKNLFKKREKGTAFSTYGGTASPTGKQKPFSGFLRMALRLTDIVLGILFLLLMFFIASVLLLPLVSEAMRPVVFIATFIFSVIVLWRA